jgi:hypothetical protein
MCECAAKSRIAQNIGQFCSKVRMLLKPVINCCTFIVCRVAVPIQHVCSGKVVFL